MNVHFILHESFEVPGAYLTWAKKRGHKTSMTKVYEWEELPEDASKIDFLIIMGGPQSPDQDRDRFPYYHPDAEIALIQDAITKDCLIVGVCLGAQLLSHAYGGHYEHSPHREIGVYPIALTANGKTDPHLQAFGSSLEVGHWHGDMPGLADDAVVLAESQGCPRQIVRFSPKHYAFQAHLEFDSQAVEGLIIADGEEELERDSHKQTFVQSPKQLRSYDYREMNQKLYDFLDSFSEQVL